jgi:hypothetical protein
MSNRGRRAFLALLPGAVLAFYGRALHRGFTSEDFLLLRLLRADPPWHDLAARLASPWLGLQLFKFYRPVSTLLFGLEAALFGTAPVGYNLAHTLVHAGNALLVYAIARRIAPVGAALGAGLLFALYPLHPNAVVFAASFATIFATAFLLGAFLCHQIAGERSSWAWETGSLVLFALALGSYEAAAILPLLLIAHDLLLAPERPLRSRLAGWLPSSAFLGLYFLLRRHLFGVFLGGYEETGRRLLAPQLRQLLGDLVQSLYRLYVPLFEHLAAPFAPGLFLLLVGLLPLVYLGASAARRDLLPPVLFGWIWTIAALAPFAFRPVVPGTGRYAYLAVVGASLGAVFLAQALADLWRGPWRLLPALAISLLGLGWAVLLAGTLGAYLEAGRTAQSIADPLRRALQTPGGSPVFVAGAPAFLENRAGAPVAAVFHYGLADAVAPPFATAGPPVYPLPALTAEELLPLVNGRPQARIYEWEPVSGKLREIVLMASSQPVELALVAPADGAQLGPADLTVSFQPGAGRSFRLIVLARGNPTVTELTGVPAGDGTLRAALPRDFLLAMDHLYGSDVYWWIEGRDERGRLLGSRARSFRLVASPNHDSG